MDSKSEEPSCRQIRSDGTEEECNQSAVWPWMIAGSGVLLAGAAGAGGQGSDRPAPIAAPAPAPATPGAPIPPPQALLAAPRLSTSSGKDTIAGTGHVNVELASPGGSWVYRIDGDNTWHVGQGSRIDTATLNRGVHAVMVAQVDDQGRRGDVATLAVRVHDEVLAPALVLAHDNGASAIDGLTNDGTITVSGLVGNATWFYRVNDATDWIKGTGDQVPAGALVVGRNKIEAYQVDAHGEPGPRAQLDVTLDLTPPDAPVLQTSNGADLLNAKDFINVSSIEGGAGWKFRVNGQGDWIDGHDGRIPAAALSNGENRVEVVQVDAAGNTGAMATLAVRQDLDAPDRLQARLEGGRGDLMSMQGAVALDNLEDGATWKYRINGESDWHVGSGSQLAANYLVEGFNDVMLMQTDSTGHDSAVTTITVTRDSLAPEHPDLVTSDGLPVINGHGSLLVHRLEQAATWEYRIDGGDWKSGTGDTLASGVLHEGNQNVDVRQTDRAGNVSQVGSLAVTLDSTAPDIFMASVHTQGGKVAVNNLINATGYVSLDNLEAGATWQFKVDGDDRWRQGSGTQLSTRFFDEGANTMEVRQIDAVGNIGAAGRIDLVLDTVAPHAPTVMTASGNILLGTDGLIVLEGLEAASAVTMLVNGVQRAVPAGKSSFQVLDPGYGFREGTNSVDVSQTDAAGNTSATARLWFAYDSTIPKPIRIVFDGGIDKGVSSLNESVGIADREQGATVMYRIDGGAWKSLGAGDSLDASLFANQPGTPLQHDIYGDFAYHKLAAYQIDQAGNMGLLFADMDIKSYLAAPPAGI